MKKLICLLLTSAVVLTALCSCDFQRKLDGVELKFQQKVSSATEYSFNAELKIESDGTTSVLNVNCYKKDGKYSYVFPSSDDESKEYRRLYADGYFYEFLTAKKSSVLFGDVEGGTYYKEEKSVSDDKNFLYQIEQNILLATYATLVLDGKKETLDGKEVYRYELTVENNTYKLWYDDANLVKIGAIIRSQDGEGNEKADTYEAKFSDYKFEEVDATVFRKPEDANGIYAESSTPLEDTLGTLGKFSGMSANWMK